MDEFQSDLESDTTSGSEYLDEDQNYIHNSSSKRRSFVYKYFRALDDSNILECIICKASVGRQTSNLSRHLQTVHNITKRGKFNKEVLKRGRPTRSFIWKYCTRENEKQAFCHLCKKLLFFGGGNTSNITKHLRRKHADIIESNGECIMEHSSPEVRRATASISQDSNDKIKSLNDIELETAAERKERKGSSYVWNYCVKLSRHAVRCKLCTKVMRFHGTANVITHLQRKHNIVGKADSGNEIIYELTNVSEDLNDDQILLEEFEDSEMPLVQRRGRGPASVVWKYCTRLNKDTVRCSFCKKNLSYQGTSNLQRHLHRMHGIVANGRPSSPEKNCLLLDIDSIWEYCTPIDEEKIKCNMCNAVFNYHDTDEFSKHLVTIHAVGGMKRKRPINKLEDDIEEFDELSSDHWIKAESADIITDADEPDGKRFDTLYDDIIEEIPENLTYEEENFQGSSQDVDSTNPLSPQSSQGLSPSQEDKITIESKKMEELKEERVRMETEYFREKAAYYRMQKYLTALQAKKVRVELERINNGQYLTDDTTGAYTTVNMELPTN